ncbi:unnamed protein product (macronuclear) [Paramecium tetraurelia]|uniref:BHLH domain-containing protein n=1 Tax=Paramecium tetraurelia TaxID=5888 RepID=A0DTV3_PARTE|nr:uncharacterized protein GSPATT00020153001 [Paramecium tetraurelia]CAK86470.1 unnamed protein product [Paramecium tetraurelia]|eukprot:XP_001453867.1 hypothetical protein (macronuclear) [Paramecium tetraurelia strain d4-2]
MQISHQSLSLTRWLHEQDQQNSPQIYQVVNQIVNRKQHAQKRSVSLCQRRYDQEPNKSNLIDQSRNKSQIFRPPRVPTTQNKILELKKVMEFLQHNQQYKYDTHRTFNLNDPKFQKETLSIIEQKKEQFKIRLNQQQNKRQLQLLSEINSTNISADRRNYSKTKNQLKKTHFKTDQQIEIKKSNSINRIQSIKDIMPKILKHNEIPGPLNKQVISKGLEFLQQMVERQKENIQHYLPKPQKYLK